MWVKVDAMFLHHPKVAVAARAAGRGGWQRVAAVWLEGVLYAMRHRTDGFVARRIARRSFVTDPRADLVFDIFARPDVRLVDHVDAGWRYHDWADWQIATGGKSNGVTPGTRDRLSVTPSDVPPELRPIKKQAEGSFNDPSTILQGFATDDKSPKVAANSPKNGHAVCKDQDRDQETISTRTTYIFSSPDIRRKLYGVAHRILDGDPAADDATIADVLKTVAARRHWPYRSDVIGDVVRAVRTIRSRRVSP